MTEVWGTKRGVSDSKSKAQQLMSHPQAHWDTSETPALWLFSFPTQVSQHPD